MWLWILLTATTLANVIRASPEQIDSDFSQDDNDDDLYLYMNERSFENAPRENREIEARRRSALDKNFMRFGRSNTYPQKNYDDNYDNFDEEDFSRITRTHNKNDNFIRFGRGGDFMRFGRDSYLSRNSRGLKDKNFIRFGRSVPLKRSRRSAEINENMGEYKRTNNRDILRFGRGSNRDMMRFGRANNRDMLRFGRRDNFLRFGRFPYNQIADGQLSSNHSIPVKLPAPIYSTLFDLLAELALQMRNAEKESTSTVR